MHNKVNRNLWGSRLFNEGQSAANRRKQRSTRRRYNKRRERLRLLKKLMNDMIMKVDSSFFIRLEHLTFLDKDDKYLTAEQYHVVNDNYNLFIDKDFNDATYYEKFPTIYHLRQYLMDSKEKADPRLIYLACHHILKYRGHFLFEGQNFNINDFDLKQSLEDLFNALFEGVGYSACFTEMQVTEIKDILLRKVSSENKQKLFENYFKNILSNDDTKNIIKELSKAIVGLTFNLGILFNDKAIQTDEGKALKFVLDSEYDEKVASLENILMNRIDTLSDIKAIYDWFLLQDILGTDNISLSHAMILKYESHKKDLFILKEVLKEYNYKGYKAFFKRDEPNNYYNYIHHASKCDYEKMLEKVDELIKDIDDERLSIIKGKIASKTLFSKQNSKENSVIPYQLNLMELKEILSNQAPYYKELQTNKDKIISLLTFKIPYYYGPLNPIDLNNHWLVKAEGKENERITAWNHKEVVDQEKTAENFITRMTNYCTYFLDQPVLPKNSLIVSQFEVLNELNKIRVNEQLLPVDLKNRVFENLFMKKVRVIDKDLKQYFIDHGEFLNNADLNIEGYQKYKCFSSSLKPWYDFTHIFGKINDENFEMIEEIIYDITVFNDKSILQKRLKRKYKLDKVKIKQILGLKYTEWSRLSRKLLYGIYTSYKGEYKLNIIDVMMRTNMNLMEVINDDTLQFKEIISKANAKEVKGSFTYDEVVNLHGSPAIKKSIWQSLQIIDEIIKIMKCRPENIFIEFAREEGKKGRTISRKTSLENVLKEIDCDNKIELKTQLKLEEEESLNDRKYLYYTQLGKCMYTNEPLDYSLLETYEIDHIIPRSLIKDDSLDNKVLVKKLENQYKSDDLTIAKNIQNKMKGQWIKLNEMGLISTKKLYLLTRTEFKEKDVERFIQRQIVETRQIIKHVAQIVDNHLPETKVFTIRAELSHNFRLKYNIYKNRNLNEFHHAHDAYIACVLGSYIQKRYPKIEKRFIYGDYQKVKKDKSLGNKYGFILNSMDRDYIDNETGEILWSSQQIKNVIKCFNYKDCFISKKTEEFSGKLFNVTIYPNDKNSKNGKTKAKIGVNKQRSNFSKYGGYSSMNYFPVVIQAKKIDRKREKFVNELIKIPLIYKDISLKELIQYISKENDKLYDITIIKFIKENQLIEIKGGLYYLASPNELNNAQQLILTKKNQKTLYYVNEALKRKCFTYTELDCIGELYDEICEKMIKYYPHLENGARKMVSKREVFMSFSKEEQCKIINEILKATHSNKERGEIKYNHFKFSSFGRKKIKKFDLLETTFIDQSVTGFYEKRYQL